VRLLVEAARHRRALVGGTRHPLEIILLEGGLVLDSQRLEVGPPRLLVRLVEQSAQRDCPVRERAPLLPVPTTPQIQRRLLNVELEVEKIVTRVSRPRTSQIAAGTVVIVERERRRCRAEERPGALERVAPALGKQQVALQRNLVSRELRSKLRNLLVQPQHARVRRLGSIGNRHQQAEPFLPEQRSLWRASEPPRDVDRRQPGCMLVNERFAEAADVSSGATRQPVAEAPVQIESPLLRELPDRGNTDQVVREPRDPANFECDAALDQLLECILRSREWPLRERTDIGEGDRACRDREQSEQRRGVCTCPA
jgi:hypothetical protein